MKVRSGFVSNSSSSSFAVRTNMLRDWQIEAILDYAHVGPILGMQWAEGWSIEQDSDRIYGYTIIDNFNFFEFLEKIGVPEDAIDRESYY